MQSIDDKILDKIKKARRGSLFYIIDTFGTVINDLPASIKTNRCNE